MFNVNDRVIFNWGGSQQSGTQGTVISVETFQGPCLEEVQTFLVQWDNGQQGNYFTSDYTNDCIILFTPDYYF